MPYYTPPAVAVPVSAKLTVLVDMQSRYKHAHGFTAEVDAPVAELGVCEDGMGCVRVG